MKERVRKSGRRARKRQWKGKKEWTESTRSVVTCGYGDSAKIGGYLDGGGTIFGSDSKDGDNDDDDDEEEKPRGFEE